MSAAPNADANNVKLEKNISSGPDKVNGAVINDAVSGLALYHVFSSLFFIQWAMRRAIALAYDAVLSPPLTNRCIPRKKHC